MTVSSQGEACLKLFFKGFYLVKPKHFHQEDGELFEQEMETFPNTGCCGLGQTGC